MSFKNQNSDINNNCQIEQNWLCKVVVTERKTYSYEMMSLFLFVITKFLSWRDYFLVFYQNSYHKTFTLSIWDKRLDNSNDKSKYNNIKV